MPSFLLLTGLLALSVVTSREKILQDDSQPIVFKQTVASTRQKSQQPSQQGAFRLLVLDGGGVRGLVQIAFLAELEKATGKHTSELFDGFVATSVGGAISGMLLSLDEKGKPRYTAAKVLEIMQNHKNLSRVFSRSFFRSLVTFNGMIGPKYSARSKGRFLQHLVGDVRYNELAKPLLLTSWSPEKLKPEFLANWTTKGHEELPAWMVIQGITSPPIYFPPTHIIDLSNDQITRTFDLNDGGVFANKPVLPMVVNKFYKKMKLNPNHPMIIVNIGTGYVKDPFTFRKIRNWGALHWVSPMMSSLDTITGRLIMAQIKQLEQTHVNLNVFQFNTVLTGQEIKLDNINENNTQTLVAKGKAMAKDNKVDFDAMLKLLNK